VVTTAAMTGRSPGQIIVRDGATRKYHLVDNNRS
jgi:hypothetical protein